MSDHLILFHIQGPDGDETARKLFDLLRAEFGVRPERVDREKRWRRDPAGIVEPVAVTALTFSLPAAALAARDEPFRVAESMERVLAWAVDKQERSPEEHIEVAPPGKAAQPIEELGIDGLMAAAGYRGDSATEAEPE